METKISGVTRPSAAGGKCEKWHPPKKKQKKKQTTKKNHPQVIQ